MEQETTIIFGACGGMGETIARHLAAQGHSLHLTGRDAARLAELAAALGAGYSVCDVLDEAQIAQAVKAAGPQLTGLVYAVGSIDLKPLRAVTADALSTALSLNAIGAVLAVKAAETALKSNGGSVLLFSTVAVGQGFANHTIVSAAKGAIEGVTRALAAELAPKVRVNAIAPSLTDTDMAKPLVGNEAMASSLAKVHPLGRLGQPDDVAALAGVLLGRQGGWITGQIIGVDGGRGPIAGRG